MIATQLEHFVSEGEVLTATLALCLALRRVKEEVDAAHEMPPTPQAVVALFAIAELILDGAGIDG